VTPPPVSAPPAGQPFPRALTVGIFALAIVGLGFLILGFFAVLRLTATPAPPPTTTALAVLPTQVVLIPTTTPLPPPSDTPEPTATEEPTATRVPASPTAEEETPEATATEPVDSVTSEASANVRAGPGTNYPTIGGLQLGESAPVLGRNAGSDWFAIDYGLASQGQAWISAAVVSYEGDIADLPILPAPPPPPPTATSPPASNPAPGPVTGAHGVSGQLTLCSAKVIYAVQERVCFVEWIKNNTAAPIGYGILGVGAVNLSAGGSVFQTSWFGQGLPDGFLWIDPGCIGPTDRCNGPWEDGVRLPSPGAWRLTMQVCFSAYPACINGGDWEVLSGAIVITVN
jgi:hypothetical protein